MNVYYAGGLPYSAELYHHGILGQKWGVRRFQNPDGSLTEAGRARYSDSPRRVQSDLNRLDKERALSIGDKVRAQRKLGQSAKQLYDYKQKKGYTTKIQSDIADAYVDSDPPKGTDKRYDRLKARTDKAADNALSSINRVNVIDKQTKDLINSVKDMGYNVTESDKFRRSVRTGEIVTRELLAATMAVGTSFISPVGVGIGYGGRYTTPRVKGTKYKVTY